MKKVFVLNQSKEFISKNKNLEVVSVVAEQIEETNFKSYAEKKAEEINSFEVAPLSGSLGLSIPNQSPNCLPPIHKYSSSESSLNGVPGR